MRLGNQLRLVVMAGLLASSSARALPATQPTADEIVQRSLRNNNHDWEVAPDYTYLEKDVIAKHGKRTVRSYEDLMIDGWPYQKLVAENGKTLSPAEARAEEQKLQQETVHRNHESAAQRAQHIEAYRRERRQDHELMQQMLKAFNFKLLGQETVNGHRCYVLEGIPRPDYRPINRDTEVLKGMRGTLWVDTEKYQWVKVHAEVYRPVAFGLFIARVKPGTEFTLEQGPVGGGIWLPTHFDEEVRASILFFWSHNLSDHQTYWDYQQQYPPHPRAELPRSTGHAPTEGLTGDTAGIGAFVCWAALLTLTPCA
jgi:hypothetical protein